LDRFIVILQIQGAASPRQVRGTAEKITCF
jgi:hypothetical protein